MIPTDFAQEEKLWKKLMSENDSNNIFDGYFPTIAELSRWLQACEGNYSSTDFLHFLQESQSAELQAIFQLKVSILVD